MASLLGRSVLVTGGNGGIGLGMARAVGAAGAHVVLWGRNEDKNDHALAQLHADGITAHAFACDVSDEADVERAFDESITVAGGRIDSVFANAGHGGVHRRFVDLTL
jgi:NAD(P)-dependent dehydrogenase (short-subunit alcohol dehydrogenase family)